MKKLLYLSAFSLILSVSCRKEVKLDEKNIKTDSTENVSTHLIMSTDWFQTSAEARALYLQCFALAKMRYNENVKNSKSKLPKAVVTDLDETVLDNSPFQARMIHENFEYSDKTWDEWVNDRKARALPGAVDFFNYVKSKGGIVISISNRTVETMDATIETMKNAGFPFSEKEFLYLKEKGKGSDKTLRRELALKKYDVVLFLGDNLRDFSEIYSNRSNDFGAKAVDDTKAEFGTKFIIFPNPMYGEWEKAMYNNDYKISTQKKDSLRRAVLNDERQ